MAVCMVDIAPASITGVVCGRRLNVDLCPIHGSVKKPSILDRPMTEIEQQAAGLSQAVEELRSHEGHQS